MKLLNESRGVLKQGTCITRCAPEKLKPFSSNASLIVCIQYPLTGLDLNEQHQSVANFHQYNPHRLKIRCTLSIPPELRIVLLATWIEYHRMLRLALRLWTSTMATTVRVAFARGTHCGRATIPFPCESTSTDPATTIPVPG
jgi:hypothetical protein